MFYCHSNNHVNMMTIDFSKRAKPPHSPVTHTILDIFFFLFSFFVFLDIVWCSNASKKEKKKKKIVIRLASHCCHFHDFNILSAFFLLFFFFIINKWNAIYCIRVVCLTTLDHFLSRKPKLNQNIVWLLFDMKKRYF